MLEGKHLLRRANHTRQELHISKTMTGIKIFYSERFLWQGDNITEGRQLQSTNLLSSFRHFHFFAHEGKPGIKCISGILSVIQVSFHTNHSFISHSIFILSFHLLCRRLRWMIYYLLHVNHGGKYCYLSIIAEDHTNDKLNSICFNYRNMVAILTFALCTAAVSSVPLNILKSKII